MIAEQTPHAAHSGGLPLELLAVLLAGLAAVAYLVGMAGSRSRGRAWPLHRLVLWIVGLAIATASVAGPLAARAHEDFVAHMWTNVLAGMLAPLCLVLAAPVTLAVRTLHVTPARRLSRLLGSAPGRLIAHPVTAALLSAGGLWLIYLSPVFEAMQTSASVHVLVHGHLLLTGYLFTASVVGIDPGSRRTSRVLVAIVLVLTMASHATLAKYLYGHPPTGVPAADAQAGAQLMYYVGGWVEASVIVVFCRQWYVAAGRRVHRRADAADPRPIG